jgi:hypothetical protein
VLKEWLDNGVLSEAACKTPSRNEGIKTVVNEVKIAEILASLGGRE